jgi:predicted lipoprotein with Yx(FWY)xxD motif
MLLLSSCSDDSVSQTERIIAPTSIPAPSGIDADGALLTLEVIDGGPATGLVITDHRGFAVYGLAGETVDAGPVCAGDCLDIWIPLRPRDAAVSARLDLSLYGVLERPDGIEQVTYANVPLYLWTGDREVGITGGAGVAGTWFALTSAGGFVD